MAKNYPHLLAAAARGALARIRSDRDQVDRRLRPAFGYLEKHLFDPSLNVNSLRRAIGFRDNAFAFHFKLQVGTLPGRYLKERRLETAARLLCDTELPVGEIGALVHYSAPQAFSRAFSAWSGETPAAYRAKRTGSAYPRPAGPEVYEQAEGAGETAETAALADRLRTLHDSTRSEAVAERPHPLIIDGAQYERWAAESLWQQVADRPREEQRDTFRYRVASASPAFFHALREKSRTESRKDRQRGVELAELALLALDASEHYLEDEIYPLRAQGWGWLGNAHRLALDFPEAERAFERADAEFQAARVAPPLIEAELSELECALRLDLDQLAEARHLIDCAIAIYQRGDHDERLVRPYVLRSNVYFYLGNYECAITDLEFAKRINDQLPGESMSLAINSNLAVNRALAGQPELASEPLDRAYALCQASVGSLEKLQVTWIKGIVRRVQGRREEAVACFQESREGFLGLGGNPPCRDRYPRYRDSARRATGVRASAFHASWLSRPS